MRQQRSSQNRLKGWTSWLRLIPAILWMIVIYNGSAQTGDDVSRWLPIVQKLFPFIQDFNWMHFVTYFVLAITFDFAFGRYASNWYIKILIVVLCALYGVTDEFHQSFVGGRTPDINDIRNDAIGAAIWVLIVKIPPIQKLWKKLCRIK